MGMNPLRAQVGWTFVPQPEPLREPLPLYMGEEPVIGWRVWQVERSAGDGALVLASIAKPTHWPRRLRLEASCIGALGAAPQHRAPWGDGGCLCGIWALRERRDAEHAAWVYGLHDLAHAVTRGIALRANALATIPYVAIGRVALWGRVVEHTRGYRGEYAYPLDLRVHSGDLQGVFGGNSPEQLLSISEELARGYGVPVTPSVRPPENPHGVRIDFGRSAPAAALFMRAVLPSEDEEKAERRLRSLKIVAFMISAVSMILAWQDHGFVALIQVGIAAFASGVALYANNRAKQIRDRW
jgi:hypothetical protein